MLSIASPQAAKCSYSISWDGAILWNVRFAELCLGRRVDVLSKKSRQLALVIRHNDSRAVTLAVCGSPRYMFPNHLRLWVCEHDAYIYLLRIPSRNADIDR